MSGIAKTSVAWRAEDSGTVLIWFRADYMIDYVIRDPEVIPHIGREFRSNRGGGDAARKVFR